jgi:hypothetical protein
VKTALILGGVAVAGFLIYEAFKPIVAQRTAAANPNAQINLGGLYAGLSAIGSAFSSPSYHGSTTSYPGATPPSYVVSSSPTGGQYIVPNTSNVTPGGNEGTGGYGIAGIDYPIAGPVVLQ